MLRRLFKEEKNMDKPNPVRNTKTQKSKMKLQIKLPPNRKARRRDMKRNRRINYQGYSYRGRNTQKGASGKSKYLIAKEPYIKAMKEEQRRVADKIRKLEYDSLIPEGKKKCKDSKPNEDLLKLSRQSKSVSLALKEEVSGLPKKEKPSADLVPKASKARPE